MSIIRVDDSSKIVLPVEVGKMLGLSNGDIIAIKKEAKPSPAIRLKITLVRAQKNGLTACPGGSMLPSLHRSCNFNSAVGGHR